MASTTIIDAVAYDRHSTKLQDGAVREKAIRDFARKENFLLKEFFLDAGISGKKKADQHWTECLMTCEVER